MTPEPAFRVGKPLPKPTISDESIRLLYATKQELLASVVKLRSQIAHVVAAVPQLDDLAPDHVQNLSIAELIKFVEVIYTIRFQNPPTSQA